MTTNDATYDSAEDTRAHMNNETRKALVEEMAAVINNTYDVTWYSTLKNPGEVAEAILPIIDRLLTDRAVPEPDADAVERAAKALWDYRRRDTGWEPWEELRDTRPVGSAVESKSHYRDMARAALQAAAGVTGAGQEGTSNE